MANEIWHNYIDGKTLDAYIWNVSDQVFDQDAGGDNFENWADGSVATYDVPMTNQGDGHYTVDFPAAIASAGVYRVVIRLRAGGTAAIGDISIAQGVIAWDGSAEITLTTHDAKLDTVDTNVDSVLVDTGTTLDGKIDTIDTNVDAILVDTGTTLPATLATAQTDLDTLTGADGATLATAQGNYAPAKAGDLMGLANDAITSAKYDESTAYPVKSDDSGSSKIAREGADGDTLETLSDQLDTVSAAAGTPKLT